MIQFWYVWKQTAKQFRFNWKDGYNDKNVLSVWMMMVWDFVYMGLVCRSNPSYPLRGQNFVGIKCLKTIPILETELWKRYPFWRNISHYPVCINALYGGISCRNDTLCEQISRETQYLLWAKMCYQPYPWLELPFPSPPADIICTDKIQNNDVFFRMACLQVVLAVDKIWSKGLLCFIIKTISKISEPF